MLQNESGNGASLHCELTVVVQLNLPLQKISRHLKQMMLEVQREIHGCGYPISKTELLPVKRMAESEKQLRGSANLPQRQYVLQRIAKYYKLYRLLQAGLSECYETLANYAADLRKQAALAEDARAKTEQKAASAPNSISVAEEIISDSGFLEVEKIALGGLGQGAYRHPKVDALIKQCQGMLMLKRRGLVLVGNKLLGESLVAKLWENGIRADTLMGARSGNRSKHNRAVQRLLSGQVDFLICTSVLEAEDFYPELEAGAIICYTLPHTQKSKEAAELRVLSHEFTFISNLVASQSPDCTFWLLKRQIRERAVEEFAKTTRRSVQLALESTS